MTVKLRLMRMGKKKQPTYRIVAADSASPRDGRFIEIVGTYAPRSEPSVVLVDNAKVLRWLNTGAQPTDRVRTLLAISGAWGEFESVREARAASRPATQKPPRKRATGAPAGSPTGAKGNTSAPGAKGATGAKASKAAAATKAAPVAKSVPAAKPAPATETAAAAKPAKADAETAKDETAKADDSATAEVAGGAAGATDEPEGES